MPKRPTKLDRRIGVEGEGLNESHLDSRSASLSIIGCEACRNAMLKEMMQNRTFPHRNTRIYKEGCVTGDQKYWFTDCVTSENGSQPSHIWSKYWCGQWTSVYKYWCGQNTDRKPKHWWSRETCAELQHKIFKVPELRTSLFGPPRAPSPKAAYRLPLTVS